jgi:hypothetical protein
MVHLQRRMSIEQVDIGRLRLCHLIADARGQLESRTSKALTDTPSRIFVFTLPHTQIIPPKG